MPQNNDRMINLRGGGERKSAEEPIAAFSGSQPQRSRAVWRPSGAALALLVVVVLGGLTVWSGALRSPWRAVFLTNNQVYFGKFTAWPFASTITLREVYYLQVNQPIQPKEGEASAPALAVIKLGSEVHGPTDAMTIPRSSVLYWEDMKSDSAVVQTIEEYKRRGE